MMSDLADFSAQAVSPLSETRPKKTALLLAHRLMSEITDGGLQPGHVLPSEREMLAQYGVARASLREALRFLEMQGVLTMRPGPRGGPVVSRPEPQHLASTLGLLLETSGALYRTIVEARQVLEPATAAQAAERMSDEVIEELRVITQRMREVIQDRDAFFHANNQFHSLIAWTSENPLFGHLISSLRWITDGTVLGVDYPLRRRTAICVAHDRIIAALETRDPAVAHAAMDAHIAEASKYLQSRYPKVLDRPLRWKDIVA